MMNLKVKFKTQIQQRKLGKKLFVLECINNLDDAIDQLCEALTQEEQNDPFAEDLCPYFGILWPAAEALSIYLHQHSESLKGKRVLELGCGLGYPSLVATSAGAKVLATDFHPDAEEYFKRNCRHSVLECDYRRLNWREDKIDIGQFDIVMGSDVLYQSNHPKDVALGLIRFLKPNGKIILADPGRNYLQPFLMAMKGEGYLETSELITVNGNEIFVFQFSKSTEDIE